MEPWSSSINIIDKYFSEPKTQIIIQETEKTRQEAKDKKRKFYKQTILFILFIYIIIWIGIYYWVSIFWRTQRLKQNLILIIWGPLLWFFSVWKMIQSSILESKRVTTQLFNNFLKFLIPEAQFFETGRLYHWTSAESELFINNKKDNWWTNSMINEKYRYSIYIPLLYNEKREVTVSLEWVEITNEKETWSGRGKHTKVEKWMLYKIIFTNPKHIINQSVKIIPNNNSWFKETENLVTLENQAFEEYFDVYSCDALETRIILTTNVLDKLAQFMNIQSSPYSLHFINNIFYIKRELSHDGIEENSIININRDNSIEQNKEIYTAFYNEIIHIKQLVDALNVDYFNKLS